MNNDIEITLHITDWCKIADTAIPNHADMIYGIISHDIVKHLSKLDYTFDGYLTIKPHSFLNGIIRIAEITDNRIHKKIISQIQKEGYQNER